ncbi:MAG: long-chain-fatty-acid--CoA ligase [Candidatus Nitrospinota bacterium M3_3B_026]
MTDLSRIPRTVNVPDKPATSFLIEAAEKYPDNEAMVFFGTRITYRRFDLQVRKCMNALRGLGVKKGDPVAVVAPNCPQALIAYQAILRLGAVVVMTNPMYVEREIEHQFNDAGVKAAVVLNLFAPRVEKILESTPLEKVVIIKLEDYMPPPLSWLFPLKMRLEGRHVKPREDDVFMNWRALMDAASEEAEPADVSPGDAALYQYTGGTTGTAKGVVLTHGAILANTLQCREWFIGAEEGREIFILALPIFHAFGMTGGMNLALSLAAKMVVVPKFDAVGVMKLIEKERATIFPGVPAMYAAIINHPRAGRRDISSIKYCVSGASSLSPEIKRKFEAMTGGVIVEGYGLTEASPVTHCNPLTGEARAGSIGLPLPGTQSIIVKGEEAEEAAPGEVGELIVRGPQVMRGYLNRPEETETALKGGWLFTGDMGYAYEDGFVYLMDRKKEMIITGGFNVYPKEVEEVILGIEGVAEAAVVGVRDEYFGEKVVAAVVPEPGRRLTEKEIIAEVKKNIASYKAPKEVFFRDSLPKTIIGKVLKRELKKQLELD